MGRGACKLPVPYTVPEEEHKVVYLLLCILLKYSTIIAADEVADSYDRWKKRNQNTFTRSRFSTTNLLLLLLGHTPSLLLDG